MKKLLGLFILSLSITIAQNEQQNIELPDFIITGRQAISIAAAQKPKTELISILSKDFFTPQYSSEELPFLITSAPVAIYPNVKSAEDHYDGKVKIMIGKETLPFGELNLSQSFDYYLFHLKAWGSNINDYLPNAGYNNSGIEIKNDFSISTKSEFLPGSKILAEGKYYRDSYSLFGSVTPTQLREKNNAEVSLSVSSLYSKIFNMAFGVSGKHFSMNENSLKETSIIATGKMNLRWNKMLFGASAVFHRQMLANNLSGTDSYSRLGTEVYVESVPSNNLWVTAGVYFDANSSSNLFSPFALVEILLDKGMTFGAEYKPKVEFFTMKSILDRNPFTNLGLADNAFSKYYNNLNLTFRYEYQKLFSIALLTNYSKVDNYLYYEDLLNAGKFDIQKASGVQIIKAKVNFYLQPTEFGYLFAEAAVQEVTSSAGNKIPYEPVYTSSLSYNFNNNSDWGFGLTYLIALDTYADINNAQKVSNYTNLVAGAWYQLFSGFKITADFQNILNRSNFVWKQYQEKPFDYLLGFEYRW